MPTTLSTSAPRSPWPHQASDSPFTGICRQVRTLQISLMSLGPIAPVSYTEPITVMWRPGSATKSVGVHAPEQMPSSLGGMTKITQVSQALRRSWLRHWVKFHAGLLASYELPTGPGLGTGTSFQRSSSGEKQNTPKSKPCSCHYHQPHLKYGCTMSPRWATRHRTRVETSRRLLRAMPPSALFTLSPRAGTRAWTGRAPAFAEWLH